ncbi:phosphatase 2C-like domain-containing protein, partial [Pelagophyceae sp. CCMP2097]
DRGCVVHPFGGAGNRSLFAVFDGHGEHGQDVSEFVAEHVVERLEERLIDDSGDAKHALVATFADVDFALRKSRVEAHYSGTTAVVVYRDGQKLYTANAGDSRAILARRVEGKLQALPLSKDHNPDLPDERARIVAAGGYVSDAPEVGLSARVWLDKAHTQVGLAMARSIGDNAVTAVGVISLPEVTEHVLLPNDEFLIAATDGVWEFITNDEAIDLVAAHLALEPPSAKVACERLIQLAVARWKAIEGDYRDDITCIVMDCRALYSTASADAPAPPSAQASAPAPAQ